MSLSRALPLLLIGLATACASGNPGRTPADAATVTAKDIEERPDVPIENILQAKAPGLLVRRTADGGIVLQVRGSSPFSSNNAPLYVINDLPVGAGPDGAMPAINPSEIESIKVLKGAEAARYGIEGANGVIVITTKKPARQN